MFLIQEETFGERVRILETVNSERKSRVVNMSSSGCFQKFSVLSEVFSSGYDPTNLSMVLEIITNIVALKLRCKLRNRL